MQPSLQGIAAAMVITFALAPALTMGQTPAPTTQPQQQMGPGMMGGRPGYGPGPRGDYGYGRGGWDRGPGMMDDDDYCWHMGPGSMHGHGGWGMGPGMMGGYGGMGAMGFGLGAINRLDLDENQRRQVLKIQDDLRHKNWDAMGKMYDEMAKLRDAMWKTDKRDRAAILAAYKRMSELRQQMLENELDAADKAEALLTPQQRDQLKRYFR